jgi:predicted nucleic acid-binding protein
VTSSITWTEILVPAYRSADQNRIDEYVGLFATYPHLDWVAPDLAIADLAAQIRAQYGLKTPDAIQAATAISSDATLFITNDRAFRKMSDFETLCLDDLL